MIAIKKLEFLLAQNADVAVDSISVSNCVFPHINSKMIVIAQKHQKQRILILLKVT